MDITKQPFLNRRGNADGGQRPNSNVNTPIDPTNTQSPGSGRQQYPYTYIGVVKRKDDPDRMGRIAVYIKEIHGKPGSDHALIWCDYATPFGGGTPTQDIKPSNNYASSQDSYGMWFPVPDLENEVLVNFINGDLNRGVWFACLYKQKMNAMVPDSPTTITDKGVSVGGNPVRDVATTTNVETSAKPENAPLARALTRQGLIKDDIRGRSTSSATRQNVSTAYGIRTPRGAGIIFDDGFKTDPNAASDETSKVYNPAVGEAGGNKSNKAKENQIDTVNTPGLADRTSELVRIKTRSGAQILLHETEGIVYLINRDGTSWVEMSRSGKFDVYAQDTVSIHSYGSINLVAQEDVNIEAGRNVNVKARGTGTVNKDRGQGNFYVQSSGSMHFTTGEDLKLLVGKNYDILASNSINVRSDNWDQNVNLDYQLCICENQDIKVGKSRKDLVLEDIHTTCERNVYTSVTGNTDTTINGNSSTIIMGDRSVVAGKNDNLTVGEERKVQVSGKIHNFSGASILNEATTSYDITSPLIKFNGRVVMSGGSGGIGGMAQFDGNIVVNGEIKATGNIKALGQIQSPDVDEGNPGPIIPPTISPATTPSAPPNVATELPMAPGDPANPTVATQPLINSLKENKNYNTSIADRVPEHEPWAGHINTKPSTHEPYSGPQGNLDTIQEEQAKPPIGSPAFHGSPTGGAPKGNASPVPATFDINRIKAAIADGVKNPATAVSTEAAGAVANTEMSKLVQAKTQPIIDNLINNISVSPPAAVPGLIATAQSDAAAALTAPNPSSPEGLSFIDQVVADTKDFSKDITGTAEEAIDYISTDLVNDTLAAVDNAIAQVENYADEIITGAVTTVAAIEATVKSTVKDVSNTVDELVATVSGNTISDDGKKMIASFEMYVPFEYPDGFNPDGTVRTSIGYGHQLANSDEETLKLFEAGLTEEEAWTILTKKDLPMIDLFLKKQLKKPIAQHQYDALASFAFNRGTSNPAVRNAISLYNKGDVEGTANEFMSHAATAGGKLISRREDELNLFLKGTYKITMERPELKKVALKEYIVEGFSGEHPWKEFPGFLHKEFPNEEITQRVIRQASLVYDRSSEKDEFALPERLPENKLTEMVGGPTQLAKYKKTFVQNFDKIMGFFNKT